MHMDSVNKIITTYFASITEEEFEFRKKVYSPKPLAVSPTLLRIAYCPEHCGGCCPKFTLDYLPEIGHDLPTGFKLDSRFILFNGKSIPIISDLQEGNQDHFCKFLDKSNGRCKVHQINPFSCMFEPLRFRMCEKYNLLGCLQFGRGWAFQTTDGGRGAKCKFMSHTSTETREAVIYKLESLQKWAKHFGIQTKVPKVIELIERYQLKDKIIVV